MVAASLPYCCLLVGNGCQKCQSFLSRAAAAVYHTLRSALLCHVVCLCCAMEQQDAVLSQQVPLCHTPNRGFSSAGPAVFAPVFMCVYETVCMHECSQITQICQQSALLNLEHTFCSVVSHKPGPQFASTALSSTHTHFAALFTILYPFHFWSYSMPFTCSFSSPHLSPTSSFFLFSCHPPPPPLSSFSHAPVGEHNEMAMAALWCVCLFFCVMSHYVAL